jgi:predicted nuclease of predicted toxin-antitoxin system
MFIDNNLPRSIKECFGTKCVHASDLGFESLDDISIWNYCREENLCILTKDQDFEDLSNYKGHPPKVVKLTCGNIKTSDLKIIILKYKQNIEDFWNDPNSSLLII